MAQWPDGVWPGSTSFSNFWYNLASRTPDPSEVWASPLHILLSIFIYFLSLQKSRTSGWRFVSNISQPKTLSLFIPIEASCSITNGVAVPRFNAESQLLCMGTMICPTHSLRLPSPALLDCVCSVLVTRYSFHTWQHSSDVTIENCLKSITYLRILRTTQEFLLPFPQHGRFPDCLQGPLPSRWMRRSWTSGSSIHACCALHTCKMQSAKRRVFWNLAQIHVM